MNPEQDRLRWWYGLADDSPRFKPGPDAKIVRGSFRAKTPEEALEKLLLETDEQ